MEKNRGNQKEGQGYNAGEAEKYGSIANQRSEKTRKGIGRENAL